MNLNKELLIGLGFKEVKVNNFDMWEYSYKTVGSLCIEKSHPYNEFYTIYKKDENNNLIETCGHCEGLSSLVEMMMKINHIDSMRLGKELKQQEIKSVLGIK